MKNLFLAFCLLFSVAAVAQPDAWTFAQPFNTPNEVKDVAISADGSFFVTGRFSGSLQLGGTRLTSAGPCLYIAKCRPDGQVIRVTQLPATIDVQPHGIAVDDHDNCYVTGSFAGILQANASPWMPMALTATGNSDVFLLKCGPAGAVRWMRQGSGGSMGSGSICYGEGVALDRAGNSYITGQVNGIDVQFGSLRFSTHINSAFLASYTPQGNLRWARVWNNSGGSSKSQGGAIALGSGGTGYLSGQFSGNWRLDNVSMSAQPGGLFLARFDTRQGQLAWSISPARFTSGSGRALATDRHGRVYLGGGFSGSFGTTTVTSQAGSSDAFVARYSEQGTMEQVVPLGGAGPDAINDLTIDQTSGRIFVTGSITSDSEPRAQAFLAQVRPNGQVRALRKVMGPGSSRGLSLAIDGRNTIYTTGAFTGSCRFGSLVLHGNATEQGYLGRYGYPLYPPADESRAVTVDVFPNPVQNQLTLRFPAEHLSSGMRATLYDAWGHTVAEHTARPTLAPAEVRFNTATLPDGQYTLRIEHGQQQMDTRHISIRH
ncbi:T9SS type A sorting domain-containing protein [Hymenobacter lucidus]|uniref:SBBP repeat-containing protein n=1 Tax=Hymenobacter lucidus TaxID=2880930 RepID=A0ABS8AR69_9BACT|nr:T9SS type A sorting domain-containing protein [Hymenobacter lucidus]MCB2408727.1 SBBP repeat-containing protein [Hymenobacter lucidus]